MKFLARHHKAVASRQNHVQQLLGNREGAAGTGRLWDTLQEMGDGSNRFICSILIKWTAITAELNQAALGLCGLALEKLEFFSKHNPSPLIKG